MKRVFNSTITLSNEMVRDHQIHGQALLPGLAYVDMIYQLAQQTAGIDFRKYSLSDVAISSPLRVSDESPVELAISFDETASGWNIVVDGRERSLSGPSSEVRKYASAILQRQNTGVFGDSLDIPEFKKKAVRDVDMETVYAEARIRGLVHRGSVKVRGIVHINGIGCLAEVYVDDAVGVDPGRYLVHPALLDGSAMASTVFNRPDNGGGHQRLYIPLHYQSFICTEPLQKSCYSLLRLSSFRRANDIQTMDIDFYNAAGRPIAALRGMTTKAVRNPDQIRTASHQHVPVKSYDTLAHRGSISDTGSSANRGGGAVDDAMTIEKTLRRIYSSYLHLKPSELDLDVGFFDLGFQSVQLLALLKDTEKAFRISLSPTLLFEKSNLRELIEHIRQVSRRENVVLPSTGIAADFLPRKFVFSERESFLRDHLVFGQPALMGVTHPCLVLERNSADTTKGFPVTLRDIEFAGGPITLKKGNSASIDVTIEEGAGQRRFSTHYFIEDSANTRLCCSGELLNDHSVHQPRVAIDTILARSTSLDQRRIDRLYASVKDFTVGPMLRVIESAYTYGDSTLVLKVSLSGKLRKGNVSRFSFDPLLLNACYFFLDDENRTPREKIFIPLFIESLIVFRPMSEIAYVVNSIRVQKDDYVAFDAMVFTESGECIAAIVNASLKEVTNPELLTNTSFAETPSKIDVRVQTVDRLPSNIALDIAIVGLAGRYPQSRDVQAFWDVLRNGKDCITEIPEDRWDWRKYYSGDRTEPGCMYSKWGGFIEDMDRFDPRFFGISPREAEVMDPQERLFLQHCWMALEDAGYTRQKLQAIGAPDLPGNVGVYVGVMSQEYPLYAAEASARGTRFGLGSNTSSIATRVSFVCDLHGPSMAIDTMCSSSLTAIETAARALADGRIDAALAGGVNLTIHPNKYLMLSQGQFISSKGRCESFGEGGDGYIPGEGVGVLFLKRLSDAERDQDHIYGVIKGAALNHGGRASGYTVPNPKSQSRVIARALKESGIHPESISYIEAHGTGTKLGDPVEIAGLSAAYREMTDARQFCWLGSVKSNIGHCESAAGVAGITKVLLQMQYGQIVPSLHSEVSNPTIDFGETPFVLNHVLRDWKRPVLNGKEQPRRAGVSSFGAGGSNAHIILEEYRAEPIHDSAPIQEPGQNFLIVLSAKRQDSLRTIAANLHEAVHKSAKYSDNAPMNLGDLAFTLQTGREAMDFRLGLPAQSIPELAGKLAAFLEGKTDDGFHYGDVRQYKETLGTFTDDPDFGQLINAWIEKKKYNKILDFWVKGGVVDWAQLNRGRQPRKVSLPVYPFARERYWLNLQKSDVVVQRESECADLPSATFQETWQEQSLPGGRGSPPESSNIRTLVCFLSNPEYRQIILENIQSVSPACTVVFISTGREFRRSSSKSYDVAGDDSESLQRAFINIREDFGDIDAIVYLWALDDDAYIRESVAIVHSIHALTSANVKPALVLLGGLFRDLEDRCFLESWIGFDRSLKHLLPDTRIALVHGDGNVRQYLSSLVSEVHRGEQTSVFYSDGHRYVSEIQPLLLDGGDPLLRTRGTYVISGGCGHLGYTFAKYLAKRYQANLILIGRSPLNDDKERKLNELADLGGQATYVQADIANESLLKPAIAQVKSRFGLIHGVIHAAGCQPESTMGWNLERFHSVLAPKIQGTIALDLLFATEQLDFVCYFSSSAAILGDLGSCDYAIGNRFQMAHARYRNQQRALGKRHGVTVVINWPIWKVGGIGFEDDNKTEMYLKSSGQRLLETDEGIEIFERVLKARQEQCLVLAGDQGRIRRFLGMTDARVGPSLHGEQSAPSLELPLKFAAWPVDRQVIQDLRESVSDILKIPADELDVAENWIDFGFDSVTLTELAAVLTKHYRIEINPVQFYSHPTIESLAEYLLEEHAEAVRAFYQAVLPSPPSGPTITAPISGSLPHPPDSAAPEPIAIIGLSGRFPKSRSIDEMWQILVDGQDAVEEIPVDRFDWRLIYGNPAEDLTRTNGKWCGCIPGVDEFDPLFFEISPREAESMDPRQRLLLMEAWKALEDAGYGSLHLRQGKVGMFVGTESGEHATRTGENAGLTANHDAILAARLAYFLNLKGPNIAINTACSSGLVAAHLACQSLRNQECDTAIAAGVNILLKPDAFVLMGQAGMLSSDGKCFTFDRRANGIVPGEAVVAVVLKRLSEAERDGDPIYAVIQGSGVNYDGRTNGITAPSGVSQTELMNETWNRCRIEPDEIDYVVTHGTGTQLGDPIEVNALFDSFKASTKRTNYCALTSNKTNFGHTMAASGLVSLVNVVQAMRHETIPASLHCETENNFIPWEKSPFFVNKANKPWPHLSTKQRVAAVSSFGMSGTNVHMLVRDYHREPAAASFPESPAVLLVLSAKSKEALSVKIQELIDWIQGECAQKYNLVQVSYTLLAGRQHFEHRCAIVAADWEEAERLWKSVGSNCPGSVSHEQTNTQDLLRQAQATKGDRIHYKQTLLALADHYCKGNEWDWDVLFGQARPQRLHLPTYPFSRQSYGGKTPTPDPTPLQKVVRQDRESREQAGSIDEYLIQLIAGHLKLSTEQVEFDKDLDEYGLDSIEAASLVHKMAKTFADIPQSLFLEHRTLREIRAFLCQNFAKEIEVLGSLSGVEEVQTRSVRLQPSPSTKVDPGAAGRKGDVSIIGMAGLFPGATSIDAFVDLLRSRKVATSSLPERRKHLLGLNGNMPKDNPLYGGYLEDIEYFDYRLFKLSLTEGRAMDPQLRKLLEVISQAIADAGTTVREFRTLRTGLYVATKGNSGYQDITPPGNRDRLPSETPALYANRISNILNLQGPSEVIDTGCSSFLVAIKQAITALRDGRCDQAIVATGELNLSPSMCGRSDTIGLYTRQPDTKSFGSDSDGYVKSEVIGAIIIKPAEIAIRDGCPIYGNIKGVGVCHGGKAPLKWYSPNIRGQKLAIEEALADSGIDPETVMYIEAEANGSQLGDASEIAAIQSIYGGHFKAGSKMRIGSLKPLIGHAENASTFTALVKLIHSMRLGRMQEVHGLREINKGIVLEDPFEILREEIPWPRIHRDRETVPRRGAVHSLAVGGVNAHLILEEPAEAMDPQHKIERNVFAFVFSEQSDEKLRLLIADYGRFLQRFEEQDPTANELLRLEYTLQAGRDEYRCRLAVIAGSISELKKQLLEWLDGAHGGVFFDASEYREDPHQEQARIKLNGLVREWVLGKTVDWSSIQSSQFVRRLNLPGNPLEKNLCWHEGLGFDGDANIRTSSVGPVFLSPQWIARDGIRTTAEPLEYVRTVISCDWSEEQSVSLAAQLGRDCTFVRLDHLPSSSIDRRFVFYAGAVFEIVQQAIRSHLPKTGKSIFVQILIPDGIESVYLQGIAGLLRTAQKENQYFTGQLIVLSPALDAATIVRQLEDNFFQPADTLVQYVSEKRQLQIWKAIPGIPARGSQIEPAFTWKDGGVFLVTGGAGGLGRIVARSIACRSRAATIIMAGRSPFSSKIKETADQIHALGARVIYEQVDITDEAQVHAMVERIVRDCGSLTSIIHCAGIVDDQSILNKTLSEVQNVLRPKVAGLCNLDESTKSLSLDSFILFSSVAAVFGNPGQSDYATANSFMNGFSVWRNHMVDMGQRRGRSIAINWPLWADGGMDTADASKDLLKRKYTVTPLPTEEGLKAMDDAILSGASEICVLYGDVDKVLESVIEGRL